MDWISDNDENNNDNFSWETFEDDKESPAVPLGEASEAGSSQTSLYSHFIGMGFSGDMVEKAITENGEGNVEAILESLLTYSVIENSPSDHVDAAVEPVTNENSFDSDTLDTDDLSDEDSLSMDDNDTKLFKLVEMGFSPEEASAAIDEIGLDSSLFDLIESICWAQIAMGIYGKNYGYLERKKAAYRRTEQETVVPKEPVFSCPICMNSLIDACSTICGHVFCQSCIKQALQSQKKCPTCRRKLTANNFHRLFFPAST